MGSPASNSTSVSVKLLVLKFVIKTVEAHIISNDSRALCYIHAGLRGMIAGYTKRMSWCLCHCGHGEQRCTVVDVSVRDISGLRW